MAVSGSISNPSIAKEPVIANSTQIAVSTPLQSVSPITTKAEARSEAAESSLGQGAKKQKADPNAGVQEALEAYFADMPLMVVVAKCESGGGINGSPRQFGPDGSYLKGKQVSADTGVLQVNKTYHQARSEKLGYDIETLAGNMAYARLLQKEQGYWPWISSWPCWGKSPLAASFNAQREARLAAKAAKAAALSAATASAVNAAAVANTASVTSAIDATKSVIAER